LRAEAIKRETEFLSVLPGLVIEKTTSYLPVLARKYLQLTYVDEYGTREYGSFHSEVDRFIGKFISGLAEDHQRIAHAAIVSTVEEFAIELERNDAGVFNPDMSPLDYERHYANAFSRAGWSTTMTPNTADQGADVVLSYKDLRGVVQCKLYGQPVGNSAVQEVIAAREYYRAPIAIVVSNAPYTTSARQLAATANVDLLHHDEIALHSQKLGVESDSVEHSTAPQ
jgi:restriction system protein